jgi:uncharacterized protein
MIFHLSLLVHELDAAAAFYSSVLGCPLGRRATTWVDIDFFGHQLSLHLGSPGPVMRGVVDDVSVPMPHFGVILDLPVWHQLVQRIRSTDTAFVVAPQVRFAGFGHEQATFFVADPSGNHLEFKGLHCDSNLLATDSIKART